MFFPNCSRNHAITYTNQKVVYIYSVTDLIKPHKQATKLQRSLPSSSFMQSRTNDQVHGMSRRF